MIPALVLTAGLATRLRPLSLVRAKAVLPVAGTPLVRRILQQLHAANIRDVVLNLHHLPSSITGAVGDGSDLGLCVRYSWENPVLGSAGGPRRALPLLRTGAHGTASTFLIVNGDTLTDVSLPDVISAHRSSGALVTMAVVPNTEPMKYGGALVDEHDAITGFVPRGSTQASWHVIGVQVAEMDAFADIPDNVPYETVRTLYPALIAARPGSVRAFRCRAEFFDIGTPADYLSTSLQFAQREGHGPLVGARSVIDPSARVQDSVIWDDVIVEAGAMLRECVVTDGIRVPSDTSWHGVSLRVSRGPLEPNEREYDGIAIAALDEHERIKSGDRR
jgi:NDP-sugar pyrophosphorylase family protein